MCAYVCVRACVCVVSKCLCAYVYVYVCVSSELVRTCVFLSPSQTGQATSLRPNNLQYNTFCLLS